MKNKMIKGLAAVLAIAITMPIASSVQGNMSFADSDVAINSTNFPDANFREYISSEIDFNHNGVLSESEISRVTYISVIGERDYDSGEIYPFVSDLTGIEFFVNLGI